MLELGPKASKHLKGNSEQHKGLNPLLQRGLAQSRASSPGTASSVTSPIAAIYVILVSSRECFHGWLWNL